MFLQGSGPPHQYDLIREERDNGQRRLLRVVGSTVITKCKETKNANHDLAKSSAQEAAPCMTNPTSVQGFLDLRLEQ